MAPSSTASRFVTLFETGRTTSWPFGAVKAAIRLSLSIVSILTRWVTVVVNATPLGMKEGDPLPLDVTRIDPAAMVGEVVMKTEYTPLLQAALAKGCGVQVGTDMLFEMIPAYLEFFGYGTATADELRAVAQIKY